MLISIEIVRNILIILKFSHAMQTHVLENLLNAPFQVLTQSGLYIIFTVNNIFNVFITPQKKSYWIK